MKIKIEGVESGFADVIRKINSIAEAVEAETLKTAQQAAAFLEGESVKRAPHLQGFLEKAHKHEVQETPGKVVEAVVYVASNAAASSYAIRMHEGHYNLGPGSKQKQNGAADLPGTSKSPFGPVDNFMNVFTAAASGGGIGVKVGRKFMERAVDENRRGIINFFNHNIKKLLDGGIP